MQAALTDPFYTSECSSALWRRFRISYT